MVQTARAVKMTQYELAPVAGLGLTFPNYLAEGTYVEFEKNLSYHAGAVFTYNFPMHTITQLGARAGLMFLNEKMASKHFEETYQFQYLSLPILFKVKPEGTLSLYGGIKWDVLLRATEAIENEDKMAQFATHIFNFSVGAEINITDEFFVYGSYNMEINDMVNKTYRTGEGRISFKRSSVQIGVGYLIYSRRMR
ncbi:MAG: PorT family protein [Prevotellaceae bacterium]|nr:PorT family protein [Prevotellaceae bacterium]